jgi:hypothetical protein
MVYLNKIKEVIKMIEIMKNIHPIILDTIIVSVFVLITFFGVIKGIKKTLIDLFLFLASVFLGFCSYTNSLKEVIATKIVNVSEFIPAGSGTGHKVAITLSQNLIASLVVFFLFYILFHGVELLISAISKRKRKEKGTPKSRVGRFFGGIISLAYQGATILIILMCANNNLMGMNESVENSVVTRFVTDKATDLTIKIDEEMPTKILMKTLKGDLLYEFDEESIESFKYLEEKANLLLVDKEYIDILTSGKLTVEEKKEYIKERLNDLVQIATVVKTIDDFNVCQKEFVKFGEEWLTALSRSASSGTDKVKMEFSVNELGKIKAVLQGAGINERVIALLDEFTLVK